MKDCPHCGKRLKPLPWSKDENGKLIINWKALLIPDWLSVVFFVVIMLSVFAYRHDIAACNEVISDPCKFFNTSGCYENYCTYGLQRSCDEPFAVPATVKGGG